ncbi:MAG: 50S ribosomal protein L10 [Candidatus Aenigmatarchaeota archaeon]|nr:MAG: 50S ribosomal protein L10 [Candidatus Aenigmarchaeota archaeon]
MVKESKIREVEELAEMIKSSKVVGIVNMYKMPSPQLQDIKKELKGKARIRMSKKRLMRRALEKSGLKGIEGLSEYLKGQPAFIFTEMNPFKLFQYLDSNKTPAPAKEGDVATKDIIVPKGSTGLPPGAIIGQLQQFGAKTTVEDGKVAVVDDTVVAREGDVISADLANLLNALGMKPMEIGLDLIAVYEDGTVFPKSVLRIDEEEFFEKMVMASAYAFNLSLNSGFLTEETAPLMILKAFNEAKSVGLEAGVLEKGVIEDLIARASAEANSLNIMIQKRGD